MKLFALRVQRESSNRGKSDVAAKTVMMAGVGAAILLIGVSACNRNQSSAAQHEGGPQGEQTAAADRAYDSRSDDQGYRRTSGGYGGGRYAREGRDDEPREETPMFHGEPMWSQSRTHTAKENAEYHFERAGADLGAKTLDDFLTKVHRFGDHPPAGTLHLERANGDRLLYDPKDNIFAVVTRDGAPRTIFKPSGGMEYWTEQKAREQDRGENGDSYRRRRYDRGGDGEQSGDSRDSRYERSDR